MNKQQIKSFQSGSTRQQWLRINETTNKFADAVEYLDWEKAVAAVQEEHVIRLNLVPSRITPLGRDLQQDIRALDVGFAVAGAGNGGCVYALCKEPSTAILVAQQWTCILKSHVLGKVLDFEIDDVGLIVERQ